MLAKLWKKVLMLILIIACLFNVVIKLVKHMSFEKELLSSAQYIQDMQDAESAKEEENAKEDDKNSDSNTTNKAEENRKKSTNQTTTNQTTKKDNVIIVK